MPGGKFPKPAVAAAALILFSTVSLMADESMDYLLKAYRKEADLSKITKKDSAGIVDVFTRDDLEKMQARTLLDVLKTIPLLNLTRTPNNIYLFNKPTVSYLPLSAIRLYINDHDMSSSSFGSAMLIWDDVPIEYIDHIEIYKGTSSIEFGNEPGIIVIKLYTKRPEREDGGKLRLLAGDRGSKEGDLYYGHTTSAGLSLFAYADKENLHRITYRNAGYEYPSDKEGSNLYANVLYDGWRLEGGSYHKKNDDFLGRYPYRSEGGDLKATHSYLHLTKTTPRGLKLQVAYDSLFYDRTYLGEEIAAGNAGPVSDYKIRFDDRIFTLSLEQRWHTGRNTLLAGGFYKRKSFDAEGTFDDVSSRYGAGLNLFSAYLENRYDLDGKKSFVASLKGDFYDYDHGIENAGEWIGRLGYLQSFDRLKAKLFFVRSYMPIPFYKLYSDEGIPFRTNADLKSPVLYLAIGEISCYSGPHTFDLRLGVNRVKNRIVYSPAQGYVNNNASGNYQRLTLEYTYRYDRFNRLLLSFFTGKNDKGIDDSPRWGAIFRWWHSLGGFDLYNEINYKTSYRYAGQSIPESVEYTAALKYHVTSDLSVGVRGENIFGTGYQQAYAGFPYPIDVIDKKVWLNLEYLF